MQIIRRIGLAMVVLAGCMFLFAIDMFTYNGHGDFVTRFLGKYASDVGKYCFFWWLPTLIFGLVIAAISARKKDK